MAQKAQEGDAAAPSKTRDRELVSVPQALERAGAAYTQGRLKEAENICRQIIRSRPKLAEPYNLLGVILHRMGDTKEGIKAVKKAIRLNGTVANFYSNLGELERLSGHLDEAAVALRRALVLDPDSPQALNNLGITFYEKRSYEEAENCYLKALEINPQYAEVLNNLGNTLRALNREEEAIERYTQAIDVREAYPEAYNNMGTVLRDQGKFEEAEGAYRRALAFNPQYLEAMNNMATLFMVQDRHDEALRLLGDALRVDGTYAPVLLNTGRIQLERQNTDLAEAACQLVLKNDPDNVEALCLFGQICHDVDRFDDAIQAYEKALELRPGYGEAINYYGIALKSVGRLDDARKQFLGMLERQPRAFGVYSNLADLQTFSKEDPTFVAMEKIIEEAEDPDNERFMGLHFALAKAYDDIGDYERGFEHLAKGTQMKRAKLNYNEEETFRFFDDIRATFTKELLENRPWRGHPSTLPIFIVGMPRSGSTLVEQILSSHPDVYGAGEIKVLSRCIGRVKMKYPDLPKFPHMMQRLKPQHFQAIGDAYLSEVSAMSETAMFVTDKLLTNYYFVGFINILFPNAKIIHTMRNPMDTCLSCFSKLFKDDMPHSYDLRELGRYHRKYQELMQHWREVLPEGVMLEMQYEDVVADLEGNARKLVDFCGLGWNEAMLSFYESSRPVKTASVSQVRKPVYTNSVERWRRYEEQLAPLKEALEA